jgi:hypothetical protein
MGQEGKTRFLPGFAHKRRTRPHRVAFPVWVFLFQLFVASTASTDQPGFDSKNPNLVDAGYVKNQAYKTPKVYTLI